MATPIQVGAAPSASPLLLLLLVVVLTCCVVVCACSLSRPLVAR
jgi:hypothetical protein